jgi:hypothetical protein
LEPVGSCRRTFAASVGCPEIDGGDPDLDCAGGAPPEAKLPVPEGRARRVPDCPVANAAPGPP